MNKVVPMHGFGGGGALLNFEVVGGTTEPTNPKENTIWVNMASAITGWYFGSDEPDVREEGTLWITTGVSSNGAFNALKKNGLKVYPISAKHYRSGVWVEKPVKIYQNGAWSGFIDWDTYLYRYDHPNNPAWVGLANTTVSTNDDGILIAKSTTMTSHCTFGMNEAIDITNVSALRFVYSSETLNYGNRFGVTASKPITGDMNQYSTYVAANTTESLFTFKEVVLDVSALSGFVYVSGCLVGTFYIKEVQKV